MPSRVIAEQDSHRKRPRRRRGAGIGRGPERVAKGAGGGDRGHPEVQIGRSLALVAERTQVVHETGDHELPPKVDLTGTLGNGRLPATADEAEAIALQLDQRVRNVAAGPSATAGRVDEMASYQPDRGAGVRAGRRMHTRYRGGCGVRSRDAACDDAQTAGRSEGLEHLPTRQLTHPASRFETSGHVQMTYGLSQIYDLWGLAIGSAERSRHRGGAPPLKAVCEPCAFSIPYVGPGLRQRPIQPQHSRRDSRKKNVGAHRAAHGVTTTL